MPPQLLSRTKNMAQLKSPDAVVVVVVVDLYSASRSASNTLNVPEAVGTPRRDPK